VLKTYQGGKTIQTVATLLNPKENIGEDGLTVFNEEVVVLKELSSDQVR
jgi:hypothetical protein